MISIREKLLTKDSFKTIQNDQWIFVFNFLLSGRRVKCLDPNEDGSCSDNECFCPCDCNKYQVAFKGVPDKKPTTLDYIEYSTTDDSFEGSGSSFDVSNNFQNSFGSAKSLDIQNAQTFDIINQIDLINKNLFKINKDSTKATKNDQTEDKCYCHCKCCNKNEKSLDPVNTTRWDSFTAYFLSLPTPTFIIFCCTVLIYWRIFRTMKHKLITMSKYHDILDFRTTILQIISVVDAVINANCFVRTIQKPRSQPNREKGGV